MLPNAIEAETALLGAILFDNAALNLLPGALEPGHFSEPFHQRIYARMRLMAQRGQLVEPIAIATAFASDQAFEEVGGMRYFADLVDRAPPAADAAQYGRVVIEVGVRRSLMRMGADMLERGASSIEDPRELLLDVMQECAALQAAEEGIQLIDADTAIDGVLDYVDNPSSYAAGVLSGLESLDEALGPWLPTDLITLAGRPGMGKSAIAGVIETNVAKAGHGVIAINAEMTVAQQWRRRLAAEAFAIYSDQAFSYSKIRKRTLEYAERQMLDVAAQRLRGLPIAALKRSGITISRMKSLIIRQRQAWEKQGIRLGLVTIDHGGIVKPDSEYRSRTEEQTAVAQGLKQMADDLDIPILVLLQLSRDVEKRDNKRPTLSDLRDSGEWEQSADVVIGVYRDAYYAQHEKEPDDSTVKGKSDWGAWDQRKRSPWIEAALLKVREGELLVPKLWANMRTNTVLGAAPADNFFGGL